MFVVVGGGFSTGSKFKWNEYSLYKNVEYRGWTAVLKFGERSSLSDAGILLEEFIDFPKVSGIFSKIYKQR